MIPDLSVPKAVQYTEPGDVSVLSVVDVLDQPLVDGQVRVEVVAAGINPFDFKMRMGVVPMPLPFPRCTGNDFAGRVIEVGPGASYEDGSAVTVGDGVLGFTMQDALREHVTVPASNLAIKPNGISWEQAGSLATPGLTAQACIDFMQPGPSDIVFLSAAAGSVGALYAQIAITRGARVIGSASSSNADYLRSLGVIPVDYEGDLAKQVAQHAPNGVTMMQDNWGREAIDFGLALGLKPEKICTIVDHAATAQLGLSNPGQYARKPSTLRALAEQIAEGSLSFPIEHTYSLADVQQAFTQLETRHGRGKIVITISKHS